MEERLSVSQSNVKRETICGNDLTGSNNMAIGN